MLIDTSFDFRSDTPAKRDPDAHSPMLHRYHRHLWSKPLPSGEPFELEDARPGNYLVHRSHLGRFYLGSDAVMATLKKRARTVVEQTTVEEQEEFNTTGYTIGGMMVFPSNRVGGFMTLNGARGFHPRIADRFDLTLECIRRHYQEEPSPLRDTVQRYADFFALFGDFAGYVDHFLLHDLVSPDGGIEFFMPFDDFKTPAVPKDVDTYREYRRLSLAFLEARNQRIKDWSQTENPAK